MTKLELFVCPQIPGLKLVPDVIGLGSGGLWEVVRSEGGTLLNGISAPRRETPESSLAPSTV